MKFRFLTLLLFLSVVCALRSAAQTPADTYFPYPTVPESKSSLTERCNYLVDHFWERCNLKQSFSSIEKLNGAFGDWVSFMPYATSDTIFMSVDNFLNDVNKLGPKYMSQIGEMAERWIYSDSAEIYSEELYLPFAKAIASNKKIDKNQREKFEKQARIIENSGLNRTIPLLEYIKPDGSKSNLNDAIASRVVLFFVEPDCFDCTLAKARLSADYNVNQLIDMGLVKFVALYPGKADEKWQAEAESYPSNWIVGACDEINDYFDLKDKPDIYYIDARRKVLGKNITVEALMLALAQINQQMKQ